MIGSGLTSAGRRGWTGTVMMLAGTLAVALVSYSVSMSVSAERSAADRLARENAALSRELKAMEAEYRVRMRLPQLERWNREVLGLKPIEAGQFLDSPLLLANYGKPLAGAGSAPQLAVMRNAPEGGNAPATAAIRTASTAAAADAQPVAVDAELLAAVAALADAPPSPGRPQLTTVALADRATAADAPAPR